MLEQKKVQEKNLKLKINFINNIEEWDQLELCQQGSSNRYFQKNYKDKSKFVPEGVEGRVEYKGNVSKIIYQLKGGLRSSMGYIGAKNLKILKKMQNLLKLQKLDFMKAWYIV